MKYRLLAGCLAMCCAGAFASDMLLAEAKPVRFDKPSRIIASAIPAQATPQEIAQSRSVLFAETRPAQIHPDLWSRIRAGFALPELDTSLTRKWEQYYANRPEYLNRIIERGRRYLFHVVEQVESRGMPMEIALLPMIESAYNPKAVSPASAAGMWQFIPETGKRYGLERTWWYDGRRDVVAATDAALDYLSENHDLFGDWQLALASYNWGENAVARAVARNEAADRPTDYAELRMPDETANYVPKLMAVRNIIANPQSYGIKLVDIPNKPYFTAIDNTRHMDVKVAAQLAEIPVSELLQLNPGFIRPVIAQKEERKLVLPTNKVETFQRNLARYDKPLLTWQPYVTRPGEPFDTLASQFGIHVDELKDVNDIASRDRAARGQTILVPKAAHLDVSDRQTLAALAANRAADPVDRGERDTPRPAEIRRVAEAKVADAPATRYRVARGDTIFSIAQRHDLSVAELRALNGIRGNAIKVGEVLKLGAAAGKSAGRAVTEYIAKRGDTLAAIARKFNVAITDLTRWNKLGSKRIQPGARLVIY